MNYAFIAARNAAQKYENASESAQQSSQNAITIALDGEIIGKIAAPTVSKVIAENLRRSRFIP